MANSVIQQITQVTSYKVVTKTSQQNKKDRTRETHSYGRVRSHNDNNINNTRESRSASRFHGAWLLAECRNDE